MNSILEEQSRNRSHFHNVYLKIFLLCNSMLLLGGCAQISATTGFTDSSLSDMEILDSNGDGVINPYEALDALLVLEQENNRELTLSDAGKFAAAQRKSHVDEAMGMLAGLDKNGDGIVVVREVDEEMQGFARLFDKNQDGTITDSEMIAFDFHGAFLADEEEIQASVKDTFQELDTNRDGNIDLGEEVGQDRRDDFAEWDSNRDRRVTKKEAYDFMKADNTPVEFTVDGDTAYMSGVITAATPATVLQLLIEHPEVTTIEMIMVPGSIDDVANLRAALYVNRRGLTTRLNANSSVASGGTDFFLAGKRRIVEKGAAIGVHSWGGGPGVDGSTVPKDDPEHQKYIDYYRAVGVPEAFYWYTMEAASPQNIHIMTEDEIDTYKIRN